jgi:hypothetical protein
VKLGGRIQYKGNNKDINENKLRSSHGVEDEVHECTLTTTTYDKLANADNEAINQRRLKAL